MGDVPEGATLDETGQYWWDGSDWRPVEGDQGGGDAPSCVIGFVDVYAGSQNTGMGPLVIVDTEDNPDDHYVLHVEAGCVAVWGEGNGGNGECTYVDTWVLDGGGSTDTEDLTLAPGATATRSVSLGRLSAGSHKFEIWLNNGAYGSNEFTVED